MPGAVRLSVVGHWPSSEILHVCLSVPVLRVGERSRKEQEGGCDKSDAFET